MKIYQYDDKPGDLRLPHYSGLDIDASQLSTLGIVYHMVPTNSSTSDSFVKALAESKTLEYRDEITYSVAAMGDAYEEANTLNNYEHIHDDDEIRYITRGGGYFDVREANDLKWMRIKVLEGDLIVLPKGIYHRFAVDENNDVTMVRLFKNADHITQTNRDAQTDNLKCRKTYLSALELGSFPI